MIHGHVQAGGWLAWKCSIQPGDDRSWCNPEFSAAPCSLFSTKKIWLLSYESKYSVLRQWNIVPKRVLCSSVVRFVQRDSDKTDKTVEWGASVLSTVSVMFLNFLDELRHHLIHGTHTLIWFMLVGIEEDLSNIATARKSGNSDGPPVRTAPELVELQNVVFQTTLYRAGEETLRVLHKTMQYICHGLHVCQDEVFWLYIGWGKVEHVFFCSIMVLWFSSNWNTSRVRRVIAMERPSVWCVTRAGRMVSL